MNRKMFGKAALASLMVATTMVGCTGSAFRPSASIAPAKGDPVKYVATANKALADRNAVKAVEAAEAAVRIAPQNGEYRQILGRAYVLAGRFASAETALSDALALGSTNARTIVSLALVQVAQGRADAARNLLVSHADTVPASDYGLAMAMAGDAPEGVRILSEAIHDPSATARTRQNLAYAYALAGRWKDARILVGMDLDPKDANTRITDWAQIAEPSLAPQRVAALMGVTINGADQGQPAMLALAAPAITPVDMAAAAAAPDPAQPAAVEPVQFADAAPVVQAPASVATPVPVASPGFTVQEHARRSVAAQRTVATPMARVQKAAFVKSAAKASNWVVQLGAYDSPAVAKEKWMGMAGRSASLAALPVLTSQATVEGRLYHRLAVSGFASRADAVTACRTIRAQRGQCFVRETAPDAIVQRWAVATRGRQYAGR
ncbi:pilus assembly protein TadD [Sphingobium lactosutens]|uniref:SPOR domain-containing protein n=1 Tax=Sphingobium lactosutens TaxID=522773 RepID=UPI0015B941FD|nr:SPOR domain-containing protein [Sphingobium lactosutens]NWK98077.1 pilus assembly protein TadD [Sphingobium lactosutens]